MHSESHEHLLHHDHEHGPGICSCFEADAFADELLAEFGEPDALAQPYEEAVLSRADSADSPADEEHMHSHDHGPGKCDCFEADLFADKLFAEFDTQEAGGNEEGSNIKQDNPVELPDRESSFTLHDPKPETAGPTHTPETSAPVDVSYDAPEILRSIHQAEESAVNHLERVETTNDSYMDYEPAPIPMPEAADDASVPAEARENAQPPAPEPSLDESSVAPVETPASHNDGSPDPDLLKADILPRTEAATALPSEPGKVEAPGYTQGMPVVSGLSVETVSIDLQEEMETGINDADTRPDAFEAPENMDVTYQAIAEEEAAGSAPWPADAMPNGQTGETTPSKEAMTVEPSDNEVHQYDEKVPYPTESIVDPQHQEIVSIVLQALENTDPHAMPSVDSEPAAELLRILSTGQESPLPKAEIKTAAQALEALGRTLKFSELQISQLWQALLGGDMQKFYELMRSFELLRLSENTQEFQQTAAFTVAHLPDRLLRLLAVMQRLRPANLFIS